MSSPPPSRRRLVAARRLGRVFGRATVAAPAAPSPPRRRPRFSYLNEYTNPPPELTAPFFRIAVYK
eukprot:4169424-Pyramimonas_sp.AAC.1